MNSLQYEKRYLENTAARGQAPVSVFRHVKTFNGEPATRIWTLATLFDYQTTSVSLQEKTLNLRSLKSLSIPKYKTARKSLIPVIKPGKDLHRGHSSELIPLFVFDLDGGNQATYQQHLQHVSHCPYIYHMEQSLGGGARIYVWSDFPPGKRREAYLQIADDLAQVLNLALKSPGITGEHIDTATWDEGRLWFLAYTPIELVYHNEQSAVFRFRSNQKNEGDRERKVAVSAGYKAPFTTEEKVMDCILQLENLGLDVTGSVTEWWFTKILLPFANWKGEEGRYYAQRVSQLGASFNERDFNYQFDKAIAKDRDQVTISSFLGHCSRNGIRYDYQAIMARRSSCSIPQI